MVETKEKRIVADVPEPIANRFLAICKEQRSSAQSVVSDFITSYIAKNDGTVTKGDVDLSSVIPDREIRDLIQAAIGILGAKNRRDAAMLSTLIKYLATKGTHE